MNEHPPRLWVRRFAIVERLDPFSPIEGRDFPLRRGLNVVWGNGESQKADELLTGHSVGKTLFCRLVRYGLGEKEYAPDDFQQQVEAVLPEAYVGLEVVIKGVVWSVLRPLCRSKSIGKGVTREERKDFAGAIDRLEDLARNRNGKSNFQGYEAALEGLAEDCLPRGLESHEKPFNWESLLQWFARDQEARYVDVMVLRSTRSKTARPLDQEKSDMLVRSALGLANAAEARLSLQVRAKQDEIREAKKENEKNKAIMWAISQQLMLRHVGLAATKPDEADSGKSALTADVFIQSKIDEQGPKVEAARKALHQAQRAYDEAYDNWRPVQEEIQSYEAGLAARADTDEEAAQELKEFQEFKRWLKDNEHLMCPRCEKIYKVACEDRLAEEDELRSHSEQRRDEAMDRRRKARDGRIAAIAAKVPERDRLQGIMAQAAASRDAAKDEYNRQTDVLRGLEAELADVKTHLAGVQAAKEGRGFAGPLPIRDVSAPERELAALEGSLADLRIARQDNLERVRDCFQDAVHGVLSQTVGGNVELDQGRLRFSLMNRGSGDLFRTLTVILFDLSTLILTMKGNARLPGLLIHDSPREADMQQRQYDAILKFAANGLGDEGGEAEPPFQYIVTTTTPAPDAVREARLVVLELNGVSEDGLLLKRRIGEVG